MRRKKRGISSRKKIARDSHYPFRRSSSFRNLSTEYMEYCCSIRNRSAGNVRTLFDFQPGTPSAYTRWTEQREKAISRAHPWLIITRIGPTVADFNSECSISERAASRDTSVSSPVTTGFVLRRGNRRKLESDTEFTRR